MNGIAFPGGRVRSLVLVPILSLALLGCSGDETTIVQIVDCGLERIDLTGTWSVEFVPQPPSTFTFNCGDPLNDGLDLNVDSTVFVFNDISVLASGQNVGFQLLDSSSPNNFIANVEADSCLMLLLFLDPDDGQYINCLGTFDIATGTMLGGCDSSSPVDAAGFPVDDCDLNDVLGVTVSVF